jgi:hypothetical protein
MAAPLGRNAVRSGIPAIFRSVKSASLSFSEMRRKKNARPIVPETPRSGKRE